MVSAKQTLRAYYYLVKPGIIYGNSINAMAGFLLASAGDIQFLYLIQTLFGIALVMASACVFNNFIDRNIDDKMKRTKQRALVTGKISIQNALIFGTVLGILGFTILSLYTNQLTVWLGVIAFVDYIALYGIAKRKSVLGTIVGSVAGALPPVAGYTAVTGHFDEGAWILLLIFGLWQMPHFYAIAMYRYDDYKKAGLPVLPVIKGTRAAKAQVLVYITAFILACSLLTVRGYTGYIYIIVVGATSLYWLWLGVSNYNKLPDEKWGRKMFLFSLVVTLVVAVMLSVGSVLV
jgi:protoheme IX farnesyltransferase